MYGQNYYCAGSHCRQTTLRVTVRMMDRTYFYCVNCGRRLEERKEYEQSRARDLAQKSREGSMPISGRLSDKQLNDRIEG